MAKKLNYQIGFSADTSELHKALETAVQSLNKLGTKSSFQLTSELKEASKSALELSNHLQKATSQKTGKLDLIDFEKSLKSSGKSIADYANQMEKLGPTGQEAFLKVASAVASAELPIRRSNKLLTELWVTMKNTARWQLTSNALHGFQGALASAYGYSKDLNRSLTDIRIVSGQSAEQMAEFADQANKAAKSLSATTLDYTDAALIYYQQGLPEEEIAERTETTIKMANVTRDSAQEVSDQMTAIWNNFDDGSKSLEYYADVITALGAATASSTSEIATGLEKFAAIAETTGLSYEYATSALATVTSVTRQSADTVGTAFKTLFARIQGLTLGETLDDGTTLNKYSEALNKVGINIKDASGEMKDMDNILDEMGAKWETLGKNEQTALAQTVAGVRQYTQLMALMDNWDFFKENLTTARGAEGELDKQADIYAESWEAARDRVRVSAEDIYDSIINPDFFISLDNAISPVLTGIADMIDAAGGLGGVLKVAAFAMTKLYGDEVAVGLRTTIENFKILTGLAGKAAKETQKGIVEQAQDLTISYTPNQSQKTQLVIMQEEVLLQQKINEKSSLLSTYQLEHIKNEKAKADLYKAQAIEASKLATQLETDVSNIKEDIIIDVSLKKGWKDDLKKSLGKKDDADLAKTIFGSEFQKSGKNATELVEKLNKMGGNSRKMVDQVTSEMQKLIKTTAGMNTLKRALGDLDSITDENAKSFKEAAVALKLMTQEEVNSIKNSSELTAKLKGIDSTVSNSGVKIKDLKTVLSTLGADSTQLRAFVSNLREFATELSESETYLSLFEEEIENLSDGINQNTIPDLNDWASELVNVANSLSAVGMGIQGIQSLGSIWMDEDATIGEKIIHTMTSLAMILPAITALQELYTKAKGEDGIVSTFAAGAQGVMAAASQKLGLSAASATPGVLGLSAAIKTLLGPIGWFLAVGGIVISLFSGLKDALGGEDDLDNFAEAEKNLNNVNAELQETQNRINELKSKGNLSVVEAQELADLERKNDLLKEELKLREQILKTEKIEKTKTFMEESTDKADEIKKGQPNLKKPYSVKVKGTESKVNLSGDIEEAAAIAGYETLEEAIRSDDSFAKWADENSKAIAEFKSEFLNTLQEMEAGYVDMLSLMESGDLFVSEEQLNTQLKALENARLNYLQGDKKEYFKVYIQPVLETEAWQAELKESAEGAKDDAIHGILEDGFYDINNFSEKTKQAFIDAGINLEDYVGKMESNVARVKEIMGDEYGFFEGLDAKTINTVLSMDLTGIDNMDEFLPILIEGQQVIDVEILTNINESAKEAFDILSSGESLDSEQIQKLQSAFAGFYDFANMEGAALYSQIDMIKDAIDQTYDIVLSAGEESLNVINEQSKAYEELLEKEKKGKLSEKDKALKMELQLELGKAEKQLKALTKFKLDPLELEIIGAKKVTAELNAVKKATSLIGADLKVSGDNLAELASTMPSLLKDATYNLEKGFVQLNQKVVDGAISASKAELDEYLKNNGAKLTSDIETAINKLTTIEKVDEAIRASDGETLAAKIANSNLEKADKEQAVSQILRERIRQSIQEQTESSQTAANAISDQGEVVDASQTDLPILTDNWKNALNTIAADAQKVFNSIAAAQRNAMSGDTSTVEKASGGGSFKGSSAEFKGEHKKVETAEAKAANKTLKYLDYLDEGKSVKNLKEENVNIIKDYLGNNLGIKVTSDDIRGGYDSLAPKVIASYDAPGGGGYAAALKDLNSAKGSLSSGIADALKTISGLMGASKDYGQIGGKGGGGKGGGGKGGSGETGKQAEPKEPDLERYQYLNQLLEYQDYLLNEIDTSAERAFGKKRLEAYSKQLDQLYKKAAVEQTKMAATTYYLEKDKKALIDLGLKVKIDPKSFDITNYDDVVKEITNRYNQQIVGASEEQLEIVEKEYDMRIKALEQYQTTVSEYRDAMEAMRQAYRDIEDQKLKEISYKLEVILEVEDFKDAARDFSREIVESFGDALNYTLPSYEIGETGIQDELNLLDDYQSQYDALNKRLAEANEFTDKAAIIDEMKSLQDAMISSGQTLLEWIDSLETMLPDAVDAARERFSLFTDQLEHNTSVLDTMKELMALQGITYKTDREFKTLQNISKEQIEASVAKAELNREWYENAADQLREAQQALDKVDEGDAEYDILKANRDALLAEYNEAQEAMLTSAQEAMEAAREMFLNEIEKASYEFSQAITDGMGLDLMQERYDHLIEAEERYLDEVNTTYEQIKWNSKLQASIDEASSLAEKNKLKELQNEFEQRKKNGEISQYDLDILNAKYEMMQKQIALEEAQNNKSQVRLVRDSQGNWDYQYTSNQDMVDKANQEYADAANDYYNIAKDQVKDITGEIIETWQEANEKIKEIYEDETLTVAEREAQIAEIREYYNEKIQYLEEQKNNALKDMTAAGGEIIGEYGNTYQDVIDMMGSSTEGFKDAFEDYLDRMEEAAEDYEDTMEEVAETTGTEYEDLKDMLDEVSDSTDNLHEVGLDMAEDAWDMIEAIREQSEAYAEQAEAIYEVIRALEAMAIAQGQIVEEEYNKETPVINKDYNKGTDYSKLIGIGLATGMITEGDAIFKQLINERNNKIEGEGTGDKFSNAIDWGAVADKYKGMTMNSEADWRKIVEDMTKTVKFDTGGYTGDFAETKLAFLHEKELILNQSDTENILSAVNAVRDIGPSLFKQIESALDSNAAAGQALMGMRVSTPATADRVAQELIQHVELTAEFPNATDQNEIRESILGLVNYASQEIYQR